MILGLLLLATGLIISAVAIYYSVIGLAAIFAAATIPIYIMGGSLEIAKLVCASWLKANWDRAPTFIKAYMMTAVVVLMFITSMGIFGFLSKAHTDQGITSGDAVAKLAIYDEKIKTARENIDANRKALKQMDEAVDQVMGRSTDEKGADKAVTIRRGQQKERVRLLAEIETEQKKISGLNEERAPVAAENRKIEAEVGPIKYIAAFIYGDNPDTNLLEKAVTWVIILIVVVFDPLAVIMLLAAQMTFGWAKEQKENDGLLHNTVPLAVVEEKKPDYAPDDGPLTETQIEQIKATAPAPAEPVIEKSILEQHPYLTQPFNHFENIKPMVAKSEPVLATDFPKSEDNEAAEEAAKWAQEQIEDSKKKSKYIIKNQNQQVKKTKE
jgi:hypothetical protein